MGLELLNNVLDKVKDNKYVKNFVAELTNYLEKENNKVNMENRNMDIGELKQENCLYQVVSMDVDGIYLKNIENNRVFKDDDISKDMLDNIGNDDVLRYKDGSYIYEEDLTNKFFESLIDVNEYKAIQDKFTRESGILEINPETRFTILEKNNENTVLAYGDEMRNIIDVPNELIPFWSKEGENLYYKDGKFNRDV